MDLTEVAELRTALQAADQVVTAFLARLAKTQDGPQVARDVAAVFGDAPDLVHQAVTAPDGSALHVYYIDGLVDAALVAEGLLHPLRHAASLANWDAGGVAPAVKRLGTQGDAITHALLAGQAVVGPGRNGTWYGVDVASPPTRAIEEPKVAQVTHGPHAGFVEDLTINLGLLRQFVRSPLLTVDTVTVGRASPATVAVIRLTGPSRPAVVSAVKRRLRQIRVGGLVDASQLMGYLGTHAVVPTVQYSERPDQVAAALVEGRVAVLMDRSPTALLLPTALSHLLTSPADYYQPALSASLVRILRYIGVVATVLLPALYVGITTVNQPLVPLPLWLSFVRARLAIPFPVFLETVIMLVAFDLVYEAGLQVPSSFGQTVSVVGALVIGQAAVMAGIVSAPTLIAVAFAYLTQLLVPDQNLAMVLRLMRYPPLLLATVYGLVGITAAFTLYAAWGAMLRPYGVAYLTPVAPIRPAVGTDALVRRPWGRLHRRVP